MGKCGRHATPWPYYHPQTPAKGTGIFNPHKAVSAYRGLVQQAVSAVRRRTCFASFHRLSSRRRTADTALICCSVRIWTGPHVKVAARYRMEKGEIEVDSIMPIGFPDITPELERESGFLENIYLVGYNACVHASRAQVRASQPEEGCRC